MRTPRSKISRHNQACLLMVIAFTAAFSAAQERTFESLRAETDVSLETNPGSVFWAAAAPVYAAVDANGREVPEYRTEVRSRWTKDNLYFLFLCPFKNLYLKPVPDTEKETYALWNWNVAEVFIGSDFRDIKRYKEFEVSPQNEWVDLDINLNSPKHEDGWIWKSGFEHQARIDHSAQIWYVAMRIPFVSISSAAPSPGNKFRINLYRTEGPPNETKEVMWRPTLSHTFHAPEKFGELKLVTK